MRATDVGLSLLGFVGWLALPKCPLCLVAYLTLVSGVSVSTRDSRIIYMSLIAMAVVCFLAGALRVGNACRRFLVAKSG